MASDEIVWNVIGVSSFCSYKLKTTKNQTFCRNEYNVSGLCTKQSCPLANSRYATVRQNPDTGRLFLYIKTIERSHLPNKWWERVKLSSNYSKALEQIDAHLAYFPKFLVHKSKQRLTRLTQVWLRVKKLAKEDERLGERMVPKLAPKIRRRESTRERKAEAAAKVERAIERELMERLRSGSYGSRPLNVEERVWQKVLKGLETEGEGMRDEDLDEGIEEDEREIEYEEEGVGEVEYVSDIEGESDEDLEDFEDWLNGGSSADTQDEDGDDDESGEDEDEGDTEEFRKTLGGLKRKRPSILALKPKKKSTKGPKREIEYEIEHESTMRQALEA